MADFSVVEPSQSFTGTLAPNASFVGPFIDVIQWTSITTTAISAVPPAISNAIQYEWSTDGINLDSTESFGSDASTQQTVHASVRAQYLRVRYTTGTSGSINIKVQTLLRNGPINSSVSRVGLITGSPDALNVNAVMMGKVTTTYQAYKAYADLTTATDFLLGVVPPPNRGTGPLIITAANQTAVLLDPNVSPSTRRWATIFNNTVRGNLYIRLADVAVPTITSFDIKIPPQHTWSMPQAWVMSRDRVRGIWDFADGFAHYQEAT